MTKADIAEKLHTKIGLSRRDFFETLETVLSIIKSTLETGENIKIAGFGNFEINQKKDRIGRNPHTGEPITIKARRILTFKPSTLLKKAINTK
jgi:integration host factor subunit alpha